MALTGADSDLVEVYSINEKADSSPEIGSITVRPAAPVSYKANGNNPGAVISTRRIIGPLDNDGRMSITVLRSDSDRWGGRTMVPYRVQENMSGSRRSYYCFFNGKQPIDLATAPKFHTITPPPVPGPQWSPRKPGQGGGGPPGQQADKHLLLHGMYLGCDLSPEMGTVGIRPIFTSSHDEPGARIVTIRPVVLELDQDGWFETELVSSDSPGWMVPGTVVYRIIENMSGLKRSFCAELLSPGPIDTSDLDATVSCVDSVILNRAEVVGL
jgi:hypothetical protein